MSQQIALLRQRRATIGQFRGSKTANSGQNDSVSFPAETRDGGVHGTVASVVPLRSRFFSFSSHRK